MAEQKLIDVIEHCAALTKDCREEELELEWQWRAYDEGVRFAFLRTYEELRQLAARLLAQRTSGSKSIHTAHRALAQYHVAYRNLQAVMLSADESTFDDAPAPGQWSTRRTLGHLIAAEREFFARIWFAVQQHRQEVEEITAMSTAELEEFVGSFADFERNMNRLSPAGAMALYDALHRRVIRELADIRAFELEAPSLWWEQLPLTVEFRLHRLDSHLRQHTIQIEKNILALTGPPSEAQRLLRLVYNGLADVEGVIIGDWLLGQREQQELAAKIQQRAEKIEAILG